MILSCRMIDATGVAFIFLTQLAFRITALRGIFCCRDRFRIFFRFGQIDGDLHLPIWRLCDPFLILFNPISADIIAVLTEFIKIIGRLFRSFLIQFIEFMAYHARQRDQFSHDFCIKQIPVHNRITNQSFFHRIICNLLQNLFQLLCAPASWCLLVRLQPKCL